MSNQPGEWDEKTWPQLHEALKVAKAALQQIETILSRSAYGDDSE